MAETTERNETARVKQEEFILRTAEVHSSLERGVIDLLVVVSSNCMGT